MLWFIYWLRTSVWCDSQDLGLAVSVLCRTKYSVWTMMEIRNRHQAYHVPGGPGFVRNTGWLAVICKSEKLWHYTWSICCFEWCEQRTSFCWSCCVFPDDVICWMRYLLTQQETPLLTQWTNLPNLQFSDLLGYIARVAFLTQTVSNIRYKIDAA